VFQTKMILSPFLSHFFSFLCLSFVGSFTLSCFLFYFLLFCAFVSLWHGDL